MFERRVVIKRRAESLELPACTEEQSGQVFPIDIKADA